MSRLKVVFLVEGVWGARVGFLDESKELENLGAYPIIVGGEYL
jgi:hypothetical protein